MIESIQVRGFAPISVSVCIGGQWRYATRVVNGWMAGGEMLSPASVPMIEAAIAAQKAAAMADIVLAIKDKES